MPVIGDAHLIGIERRHAEPALRDRLFSAASGELVGPLTTGTGHALIRVLEILPAQLDDRTRAAIQDILFNEWLAGRRQAAQIEWCWGNAGKATNQTPELPVLVPAS